MNGRDVLLVKSLIGQMQGWLDVIKRGTHADKVEIQPREGQREFAVVITYRTKDGQTKTFESYFTQRRVFGATLHGPALQLAIQRRACDFAREVLREALESRGVI